MEKIPLKRPRGRPSRKHLIGAVSDQASHRAALKELSQQFNMDIKDIQEILYAFFGIYGIGYYLRKHQKISIRSLGTFYFHKATLMADMRFKEKSRKKFNEKMKRYQQKRKQRLSFLQNK